MVENHQKSVTLYGQPLLSFASELVSASVVFRGGGHWVMPPSLQKYIFPYRKLENIVFVWSLVTIKNLPPLFEILNTPLVSAVQKQNICLRVGSNRIHAQCLDSALSGFSWISVQTYAWGWIHTAGCSVFWVGFSCLPIYLKKNRCSRVGSNRICCGCILLAWGGI